MRFARPVGQAFFPLDEELALLPSNLTPQTYEHLVRLGAWMPFEKACEFLADVLHVQVSEAQGRRDTQAAGAAYVALQTEEAEALEQQGATAAPVGATKMVLSADGAMVPLVQGEWAEVKTLVIGEVPPPVLEKGRWAVHCQHLSYFSRLAPAADFEHLSLSEIQRRRVGHSPQVAAVMDGAAWLQSFVDYHRPDAVRILDFPHAGQRLGQVAAALWGEGSSEAQRWTQTALHDLKHEGPDAVLARLQDIQTQQPENEGVRENLAYLEKRRAQMQYPHFQQQGWPIGSGMVESGNKLVVAARLKGAGMHWKRENVNPMLALRNIICSDRWTQEWPKIEQRLRQQARARRKSLRARRQLAKAPPPVPAVVAAPPKPAQMPQEPVAGRLPARPKSTGPRRPAPNHPWRRSPFGRALYQPSTPPKI